MTDAVSEGKIITREVLADLRALGGPKSSARAAGVLAVHLIVLACAPVLIAWSLRLESQWIVLLATLFAVVINGSRFRAINNMSHECYHRTFCRDRSWNERFGHLCAILELSSFLRFRREHQTHHRHLGTYQLDQDFQHLEHYGFHLPVTRQRINRTVLRALRQGHCRDYFFVILRDREDPWPYQLIRSMLLAGLLVLAVIWPVPILLGVVLPFVTTYQMQK